MNEDVFQRYSRYYDLLYRDKNYDAEAEYVARILRSADPTARKLLELGSGTGRHGRLLAQRGFDVFGVECSESMVTAARSAPPLPSQSGGSFECVKDDIKTIELDCVFDVVVALFHVVSYQTRNPDLLKAFANVARYLKSGGVFLFDVWHGPAVLIERPSVRMKRVEDENTHLTRIAEPELDVVAGVVTVRYSMLAEPKVDGRLTRFGEEHRMRYLFPSEIDLLAGQTGFDVECSEEFLTGQKSSESTWGVMYLLRKRP